jgi:hypothetical protein
MSRDSSAAGGSLGQLAAGAARHAGQLLLDTLSYLGRILLDLAGGVRLAWRRWRLGKHPETTDDFERWRSELRARRDARWEPWRALTPGRRSGARAATALLALILLLAVRTAWMAPPPLASSSNEGKAAPSVPGLAIPEAEPAPPADITEAAARMRSAMARVAPGRALFLSEGPVLAPGPSASWQGLRVAAPAVLRDGASAYRMWYRGCRLHGPSHDCAIGHATSSDGFVWTPSAEPVLVPSEGADEFDLGAIAVARVGGEYLLWYSLWPDNFEGRPRSEIHLATSPDGVRWRDRGRVLTSDEPSEAVQPAVVHDGARFHLWFVDSRLDVDDRHNVKEGAPFLRHFTSPDGRAWQEAAEFPVGPLGLGRVRLGVERTGDGSYRAFYFGRVVSTDGPRSTIGWLESADGSDWRVASTTLVAPGSLGSGVEQVTDAAAVRVPGGLLVWYETSHARGRRDIRAAFYSE